MKKQEETAKETKVKKPMKKGAKIALGIIGGFIALIVIVAIATSGGNKEESQIAASTPAQKSAEAVTQKETTTVQTTQAPTTPAPTTQAVTLSQKNAIRKAKEYLRFTAFSQKGLIDQLKFEGFSEDDAAYAIEHINVDWNKQAAKKAEHYLSFTSFSHSGLVQQLEFEGFTNEQAEFGTTSVGL